MAKNLSTKKNLRVNRRSKALNITNDMQKPNYQTTTIDGIKVKLSAREINTLKKAEKN